MSGNGNPSTECPDCGIAGGYEVPPSPTGTTAQTTELPGWRECGTCGGTGTNTK